MISSFYSTADSLIFNEEEQLIKPNKMNILFILNSWNVSNWSCLIDLILSINLSVKYLKTVKNLSLWRRQCSEIKQRKTEELLIIRFRSKHFQIKPAPLNWPQTCETRDLNQVRAELVQVLPANTRRVTGEMFARFLVKTFIEVLNIQN